MFDIYNKLKELASNFGLASDEESSKRNEQLREAREIFPESVGKHDDEELLKALKYYREGYINSEFIGYEDIYSRKLIVNAKVLRKVIYILPEVKGRIERIIRDELTEAESFFVNSSNCSDEALLNGYMHYKLSNPEDNFVPPDIIKSIEELKKVIEILPNEEDSMRSKISENIYYGVTLRNKKEACNANNEKFMKILAENLQYAEAGKVAQKIVDAKIRLSLAYSNVENYDKAIEICKSALELLPDDENAYLNLAYFCRLAGKYDEALSMYKHFLSEMSSKPSILSDFEREEQRDNIKQIIAEIEQSQRK